ncbi:MAG: hypothetical protein AAF773_01045 [Cyanobacteria bacterium P01_D01_bin.115]
MPPPAQDDPDGYVAQLSAESLEALDVDRAVWIAGRSILAAKQILADVEACITPAN